MSSSPIFGFEGGDCSAAEPLVLRLGGPPPSAARDGVLFTDDFPCGAEVSATELVRIPMRTLARWTGCVGDSTCPGGRALIQGHVQSITVADIDGGNAATYGGCAALSSTSQPRVKLAITGCGMPGPVIIDSDSALVVPAGMTEIAVIAPGPDLAGAGSWQVMGRAPAGIENWVDVALRVSACPMLCDAFWPKGVLTEWLQFSDATGLALRVLVRPRRARKLAAHAVTAAFATSNVLVVSLDADRNTPLGANTFQAGFPLAQDPFGAAPFVTPISPAGLITALLRWEIE